MEKAPARGAIIDLMMTVVTVGRGQGVFSTVTQKSAVLLAAELSRWWRGLGSLPHQGPPTGLGVSKSPLLDQCELFCGASSKCLDSVLGTFLSLEGSPALSLSAWATWSPLPGTGFPVCWPVSVSFLEGPPTPYRGLRPQAVASWGSGMSRWGSLGACSRPRTKGLEPGSWLAE